MNSGKRVEKRINWIGVTWIFLMLISVIFFIVAINFIAFPQKYAIPLGICLLCIDGIMGFFSIRPKSIKHQSRNGRKKRWIVTIINGVLSVSLFIASFYIPLLQAKMKGVFVEPANTQEIIINVYAMTSSYKKEHSDVFKDTETSIDFSSYSDSRFITQSKVDQDNQEYALEDIQSEFGKNSLNIVTKDDILSAVGALYNDAGDALVLNATYVSTISEVPGYESFEKDTQILYSITRTIEVEQKATVEQNYTNSSFTIYLAGSDTRSSSLEYYTRTDVDMLITVNPVSKQVLLVSMPRDWYVKNPALGNGYDKLTHLGNSGIQNTVDGLNQEYNFDYIKNYVEVNFVTFGNIVDALGGIDINNPYEFTSGNNYYPEGSIHLDGSTALAYVRERHNLSNGDYGRNEHQAIVMQAIIKKITSKEIITNFDSLLTNLQGNFLTNMTAEDIYSLAKMQLNDGGSWSFVSYHLGGVGDYNVTASMGNQALYVSYPIEEQLNFAKEQISKMMRGETIEQGTLPEENQTVYLPN